MRPYHLTALSILVGILLTACAGTSPGNDPARFTQLRQAEASGIESEGQGADPAQVEVAQPNETAGKYSESSADATPQQKWPDGDLQQDSQGFVEVAITPLNLNAPGETLDFSISLNTHSVDLGMDLAELATLEADNGVSVRATTWDAPRGGHHVSGVLSFPAYDGNKPLLLSATQLTLRMINLDAPERIFSWRLVE